jgi:hypothetical protein
MSKTSDNLRNLRERLLDKFGKSSENVINSQILTYSMKNDTITKEVIHKYIIVFRILKIIPNS